MDTFDKIGKLIEGGIKTLFAMPGILVAALGVIVVINSVLDLDFFGAIVGIVFMGLGQLYYSIVVGWISWTLRSIRGLRQT